ncbi:putative Na+/H+ antiporter [Polynucleobacter sp. AP-Capit-er-40B-B4]|uniref:putative Na+/H+ antiporter n=1 Tax=Polynucleobacter sp. AP-Capit-er-40B-B4 TaxID=2576927 RepID=UPI001C0C9B8C|nr:putative Na+/H+ antiporter [Polynucleobacter sp. AP-Capit-er-40B-B4]MBU3581801.1 putative Na+/H+ antiporter [Polynucleobacter sp. AP-Capit-er-40B-B4]
MNFTPIELGASVIFATAVLHTFCTGYFESIAKKSPRHAGLWHLLGEVEIVFGFWAAILVIFISLQSDLSTAKDFLNKRNFTEPLFVFAIMIVAGTKPILYFATNILHSLSKIVQLLLRTRSAPALYFLTLAITPLLGSFITEPAAMTLAAFLLRDLVYRHKCSTALLFGTLGVLFVNISIGGTLTNFAAPPVLMVASTWGWSSAFMFANFGLESCIAIFINALVVTLLFHRQLIEPDTGKKEVKIPLAVILVHILFLFGVVVFAHDPIIFTWILLFFIGYTTAYPKHQSPLILKEALLVGFFLGGLVVLGSLQGWWLQPILEMMSPTAVFYGSLVLTAFTDNAALTYLGSLVTGTSPEFKLALVGGAVAGGGLTVIANAPNPAGIAILRQHFPNGAVSALYLLVAAIPPTIVAILAYRLI